MKKKGSDAPAAALVQLSGPLGGAPFFRGSSASGTSQQVGATCHGDFSWSVIGDTDGNGSSPRRDAAV